ncbi:RecQ family zinc-binding domain-containing protein, partial [Streptomyces sp. NPDC059627]
VRSALAVHATHRKLEQSRVDMMRGYAETTDCRRRFLLGYFGESVPTPCGACGNCTGPVARPASGLRRARSGDSARPYKAAARHSPWLPAGARTGAP